MAFKGMDILGGRVGAELRRRGEWLSSPWCWAQLTEQRDTEKEEDVLFSLWFFE